MTPNNDNLFQTIVNFCKENDVKPGELAEFIQNSKSGVLVELIQNFKQPQSFLLSLKLTSREPKQNGFLFEKIVANSFCEAEDFPLKGFCDSLPEEKKSILNASFNKSSVKSLKNLKQEKEFFSEKLSHNFVYIGRDGKGSPGPDVLMWWNCEHYRRLILIGCKTSSTEDGVSFNSLIKNRETTDIENLYHSNEYKRGQVLTLLAEESEKPLLILRLHICIPAHRRLLNGTAKTKATKHFKDNHCTFTSYDFEYLPKNGDDWKYYSYDEIEIDIGSKVTLKECGLFNEGTCKKLEDFFFNTH